MIFKPGVNSTQDMYTTLFRNANFFGTYVKHLSSKPTEKGCVTNIHPNNSKNTEEETKDRERQTETQNARMKIEHR